VFFITLKTEITMTQAILGIAKGMVVRLENIIETKIISMLIEAVEFLTLMLLPIFIPLGIMLLSGWTL
tara:strand:+ start:1348 stop:1551 length:204 start_codon:yes stop_codon:yes gene_type:complete